MGLAFAESDLCNIYSVHTYSPTKMEQTVCSETLAFKLQKPVNKPEESIRHSEHGKSSKSRIYNVKNDGRYKYKDVDTIDIVMQTYS
jgi:hypothetical protein